MSMKKVQISYVGVNNLFGRVATSLLQQTPGIKKLNLYDDADIRRRENNAPGVNESIVTEFSGRNNLPHAFENADVIVLGDESELDKAAGNKLKQMAKRICDYIKALGSIPLAKKPPFVVVAATPLNITVPLVAEALELDELFTAERLFGASSCDTHKASVLLARHLRTQPGEVVVPVIGGSSKDTRVPLYSQMHPQFDLSEETKNELILKTRNMDEGEFNVTDTIERAYTTVRFLNSVIAGIHGKKNIPEISMVETDEHPGVRFLSVPIMLGRRGIERCISIPKLSRVEEEMLTKAVTAMKKDALTARNLIEEIKIERDLPMEAKSTIPMTDVSMDEFDNKECLGIDLCASHPGKNSESTKEIKPPQQTGNQVIQKTRNECKKEINEKVIGSSLGKASSETVSLKEGIVKKLDGTLESPSDKIKPRRRPSSRRGKRRTVTAPAVSKTSSVEIRNQSNKESREATRLKNIKKMKRDNFGKNKSETEKPRKRMTTIFFQENPETSTNQEGMASPREKTDITPEVEPDLGQPYQLKKVEPETSEKPTEQTRNLKDEKSEGSKQESAKKELKEPSEASTKPNKVIPTLIKTEKIPPPNREVKSHNEISNQEKAHKVSSFSYSAFVDSLPEHKRPTIGTPAEIQTVESPPSLHQPLVAESAQMSRRPRKRTIRHKASPSLFKEAPPLRKKSSNILRSAPRPSEAKKYERFRQFAGIFEKINTVESAVPPNKQEAKVSGFLKKKDTENNEMNLNLKSHDGLRTKSTEGISHGQSKLTKEEDKMKGEERGPSMSGSGKDVNEARNPKPEEIIKSDQKLTDVVTKSRTKSEEEVLKSPEPERTMIQSAETQSKSPPKPGTPPSAPEKPKSPSRSPSRPKKIPRARTEAKSSESKVVPVPQPVQITSRQKDLRTELKECLKLIEDVSPDKITSQFPQQISENPSLDSKKDYYEHEMKSSAYMKAALQKTSYVPTRKPQTQTKASPRRISPPKQKNRLSKLLTTSPVPRKMFEDNEGQNERPSSGDARKKNQASPLRRAPNKIPDTKSEYRPLGQMQLTSDKAKHEAQHSVNFKVHTVTSNPRLKGCSERVSNDRNQVNATKTLHVNQKVTHSKLDEEACATKKKPVYLSQLSSRSNAVSQESKWGKIFHVFKQVINNDLKKEEDRKLMKRPSQGNPAKRRRLNTPNGESTVMVNVGSDTFKPSRSKAALKPCPTKLKTYFSRRENLDPKNSEKY